MLSDKVVQQKRKGNFASRFLQISGWIFLIYLAYAQFIPVFDYQLGVQMGTQEPATQVTEVGVAYWWAFAFADLVIYAPLLIFGLIGHLLETSWGRISLAAAMGITVYWPIVSMAAVVSARGANGWDLPNEGQYWIVLPLISIWGAWCVWHLHQEERNR